MKILSINVPVLVSLLGGLGVAWIRWKRHPTISLLTSIALGLILIAVLWARLLPIWLGGQTVRSIEDFQSGKVRRVFDEAHSAPGGGRVAGPSGSGDPDSSDSDPFVAALRHYHPRRHPNAAG